MAIHAKLSASGSARWLTCPASVRASANIESKSSVFADEGTFAHAVAELCLNNKVNARHYLINNIPQSVYDEISSDIIYDVEMSEYVQIYLDYVRSFKGDLYVEVRCDFSNIVPEGFGTSDVVIYEKETKTLRIIDLKYGKGVKVDALDNTQAMLYALGSINTLNADVENIVISIVQPRLDHIDEWVIKLSDLEYFARYASKQAELALSDNAPFNPSNKACKWCPIKSNCSALAKHTESVLLAKFDNLDEIAEPDLLTNDRLKLILDNKSLIESFLSAVESKVFDELQRGNQFDGYKIVEGRSVRKWNELAEDKLNELAGDKAYKKSLITITEAEKLFGKEELKELTFKPQGKPTLALASDKRKLLNSLDCLNKI